MGNQTKKPFAFRSPDLTNYIQIKTNQSYQIWKNQLYEEVIQQYTLQFPDNQSYQHQLNLISIRNRNSNLVKALYFMDKTNQQYCAKFKQVSIFLQRIPIRLSDINDIPYPDILYMLQVCLKGFSLLFQRFGYFKIQENMIGINLQGKVKIWMNKNFSQSYPECHQNQKNGCEYDMVKRIMNLMEINSYKNMDFEIFSQFYDNKFINFDDTLKRLYEYTHIYSIDIPNKMNTTLSLINNLQNNLISRKSITSPKKEKKKPLIYSKSAKRSISPTQKHNLKKVQQTPKNQYHNQYGFNTKQIIIPRNNAHQIDTKLAQSQTRILSQSPYSNSKQSKYKVNEQGNQNLTNKQFISKYNDLNIRFNYISPNRNNNNSLQKWEIKQRHFLNKEQNTNLKQQRMYQIIKNIGGNQFKRKTEQKNDVKVQRKFEFRPVKSKTIIKTGDSNIQLNDEQSELIQKIEIQQQRRKSEINNEIIPRLDLRNCISLQVHKKCENQLKN